MTTLETTILEQLLDLETKVREMPTAKLKPNLLPIFSKLEELGRQVEPSSMLRHYLERKSYEKARLWLQDRDAENKTGACGPH